MTLTLKQFITRLDESGVLSEDEITAFQDSRNSEIESAEDLGKLLVKHKKVTKLQAQMVYQGKGKLLQLGNYLIQDKIGSGGMGDVYLAEHSRMQRKVALKVLPAAMAEDEKTIRRFQREVQAAAKLSHSNIVTAHDADEAKGIHYLVMEYVDGTDLSALVKKKGVLPVEEALDCILQAARGLEYAHDKGVIHRDIKPSNLLLDSDGTVKILDMGLARIDNVDDENPVTALTGSESVMGTVDYMSPEQARSTHTADCRSDIYSLGCSFYYLVTGDSVYGGQTVVNRIMAHRDQPIPSLSATHRHVPSDVDAIYQKMIAKKPEDRFQSMQEVIDAIENCDLLKSASTVSRDPSDPELHKFLQSQKVVSSPTVVMSAEKSLIDTQDETPTSDFLNNTLGGTAYKPLQKRKESIGKRGWIIMGSVLASLILMAGIVLKVDTSEGTIILEIDQPELAGAVVSVDDQKKITIKTGKDQETITVEADEQKHTLKVTKAGFETYTKQFTVKSGEQETIRVRLEPLAVAHKTPPPETIPIIPFPMSDRQIVEWVYSVGGTVAINSQSNYISKIEELPTEPVLYYNVNLSQANFAAPDLARLANLSTNILLRLDSTLINDVDLQYLKGMQRLVSLFLNNTNITGTGLKYVSEIPNLENIALEHSKLTDEGLRSIKGLTRLKSLTISTTSITNAGMRTVGELKQLNTLKIADNSQIDDIGLGYLKGMTKLKNLYAHMVPNITDKGLEQLKKINSLSELSLGSTEITDKGLEQLTSLQNLERLEVTNCQITDSGLEHLIALRNLKNLGLQLTPVTDTGLQHLQKLKKLQNLDLRNTKVTPQGIADLQKALPDCKISSDWEQADDGLKMVRPAQKPSPPETGNYALEFDGEQSYVEVPDLKFDSSQPFTLELLIRPVKDYPKEETAHAIAGWRRMHLTWSVSDLYEVPKVRILPQNTIAAGFGVASPIPRPIHLAIVWTGRYFDFYVNGKIHNGSPEPLDDFSTDKAQLLNLIIGAGWQLGAETYKPGYFFHGLIDEVRLSNIARYDKEFIPTRRFKADKNTTALYHFDEGKGDVLKDSSGNGHDGKIIGAKWVKVDDDLKVAEPAKASNSQ